MLLENEEEEFVPDEEADDDGLETELLELEELLPELDAEEVALGLEPLVLEGADKVPEE